MLPEQPVSVLVHDTAVQAGDLQPAHLPQEHTRGPNPGKEQESNEDDHGDLKNDDDAPSGESKSVVQRRPDQKLRVAQ